MAPWKLVLRVTALVIAAVATVVMVFVAVPDASDNVLVTRDKHHRLETIEGPKVVFVGGSNLAYGLDSPAVDAAVPHDVVNMGLNAFLGIRYLLQEVEDYLRPGDIAVLSFEHKLFFTAPDVDLVNGAAIDQLMMIKARPESWRSLPDWHQGVAVLKAVPVVAQLKLEKLLAGVLASVRGSRDAEPEVGTLDWVERRTAYNEYGDLERHLDPRALRPPLDPGVTLSDRKLNEDAFTEIRQFRRRMTQRGVTVLFVPPPTPRKYYARERRSLDELYDRLRDLFPSVEPYSRSPLLFADAEFFDDPDHLGTRASRAKRTELVIGELRRHLDSSPAAVRAEAQR